MKQMDLNFCFTGGHVGDSLPENVILSFLNCF